MERVWNQSDASALDDLLTEESITHGLGDPMVGVEPWRQFHAVICGAFSDIHFVVEGQLVSGDQVAARIKGDMVHRATGTPVTLHAMLMGRVVNGRFVEAWNSADWLPALTKLGLAGEDAVARMLGLA
jgi:predicted ester cyclase